MQANIEKVKRTVISLVNNMALAIPLVTLRDRWVDEQKYEDWADYVAAIKALKLGKGVKFVKATKKPFGFVADVYGVHIQVYVKIRGSSALLATKLANKTTTSKYAAQTL